MINDIIYTQIETDRNKREKIQSINKLKKQVIQEVKNYCRKINSGYQDFCYQDTMNKILKIELDTIL